MRTAPARLIVAAALIASCGSQQAPQSSSSTSLDVDAVTRAYSGYTLERAAHEGYKKDSFCLDASSFGRDASQGAMGFHATNESLLRGPIDPHRPQALMFDADGRVIGVEYEIMADAAREVPVLFGQTFTKLPAHAGVHHEHYALHLWFVHNPSGRFADFNPSLRCPPQNAPGAHPLGTPVPATPTPEDHSGAH